MKDVPLVFKVLKNRIGRRLGHIDGFFVRAARSDAIWVAATAALKVQSQAERKIDLMAAQ